MIFPKKMLKTNIVVHNNLLEEVVDRLSETGIMQIDPVENTIGEAAEHLGEMKAPEEHCDLFDLSIRLERLKDIFTTHFPKHTSMLQDMFPEERKKKKVPKQTLRQLKEKTRGLLEKIEDPVLGTHDRLTAIRDEVSRLEEKEEQIRLFLPIDIPLSSFAEGRYTFTRVGITDDVGELERVLGEINEVAVESATSEKETFSVVAVIGMRSVRDEVDNALRGKIFNEVQLPEHDERPSEIIDETRDRLEALAGEKEDQLKVLKELEDEWSGRIDVARELIDIQREKYETYGLFGGTVSTTTLSGWIEEDRKADLEKLFRDLDVADIFFEKPDTENDKVPSSLSHSRSVRPFESLVNTFSPPEYDGLDPTPFVGLLFVLFAGIMLGDAGYGAIILLGSFWLGSKVKEGFTASFAHIGKLFGIVTIITGVITGAFFGDLIPRLFYGDPVKPIYTIPGVDFLPYDSLRNPLPLFLTGLGLGLLTIYLSVILSGITHLKQGNKKDFFFNDLSLLVFIPAFIVVVIDLLGMANATSLMPFAYAGVAIGFLLLIGANLNMPLLALFEVTGFLGDLLSFARILALGLATIGLAMTWNIIAEMFLPLNSVIGGALKLLLILVILVAFHIFNFVFQTLGACIHSLRLQYIEFFNRCYSGGGVLFRPFRPIRTYTRMKK